MSDDDPLIAPPPGVIPVRAEPVVEPVEAEPVDFISLPPGMSVPADSATHRLAPRVPKPVDEDPSADIVFFPSVPGMGPPAPPVVPPTPLQETPPEASPPPPPAPIVRVVGAPIAAPYVRPAAAPAGDPDRVAEETRVGVPRAPLSVDLAWNLLLPTGEVIPVAPAVIVGRDPIRSTTRSDAALLAVVDPAKSVSKTHALLEVDEGRLWVHDLDSTNGVYLLVPGSDVFHVEPGDRAEVPPGATVDLGDFGLRVRLQ